MRRTLTTLALLMTMPGAAHAATITVRPTDPTDTYEVDEVYYQAAPGETNHVTVAYAGDARSVTVTDPGATIVTDDTCTLHDAHTATCTARALSPDPHLQNARIELGDGDDTVISTRHEPGPPIGGLDANGGPGNDTLTGSPADDTLDGGSGTDTITGGAGNDTITDGDTVGDADTLAGGPGSDVLSYAGHTAPVHVDLAASTGPDGDAISGFDSVRGGAGDDELIGIAGAGGIIAGGPGDDTLQGRGGGRYPDDLRGGRGDDTLIGGGPGAYFDGGLGRDRFVCSRGLANRVIDPAPDELLQRACGLAVFRLEGDDSFTLPSQPEQITRTGARFAFACPRGGACTGKLVLRRIGDDPRRLGAGSIDGAHPVHVRFGPGVARLIRRGVTVAVTIKPGDNLPKVGWRIRLRL